MILLIVLEEEYREKALGPTSLETMKSQPLNCRCFQYLKDLCRSSRCLAKTSLHGPGIPVKVSLDESHRIKDLIAKVEPIALVTQKIKKYNTATFWCICANHFYRSGRVRIAL